MLHYTAFGLGFVMTVYYSCSLDQKFCLYIYHITLQRNSFN